MQDYKGVWDRAIMEEAAKRCAIANGDMNEIGHVSAEMLARYMQSIKNWKNNNQWLSTYKAHFVEMRERGITFEAAIPPSGKQKNRNPKGFFPSGAR